MPDAATLRLGNVALKEQVGPGGIEWGWGIGAKEWCFCSKSPVVLYIF